MPGLLQRAAQSLGGMHGRADTQCQPAVVGESRREGFAYGGEQRVGVESGLIGEGVGVLAVRTRRGAFLVLAVRGRGDDRGQRYQGDGLLARVGDGDPVGGVGAADRRVDEDLLQQRLGHRAARDLTRGGGLARGAPVDPGHHDLPLGGHAEAGQQDGRGDPQPGRDLGGGGARLDQLQHLLGEPAAYRAGGVAAVAFDRDQLGDALEQVEPGGGPVRGVRLDRQQPVGEHRFPDVTGGRHRAPPGVPDREERIRRTGDRRPVRGPAAGPGRGQVVPGQRGAQRAGQRGAGPGDLAAGGDRTQARRSRSEVRRSRTTSGPPPAGPEVISRRCRSTTAARSPARSPET
ncbi:hypothetical protein SBADM41S_05788 [Streptomyces badius]